MAEPLTRGQQIFAGVVARETGLDPRVVGAWAKSEQSGSAAEGYDARNYHNYLNIARTDSGDAAGSHASVWSNPESAGKATAEWIKGQGPITKQYGHAAPGIRAILGTAGKGAKAQIEAIGKSGWATAPDYGAKIGTLYSELSGQQLKLLSAATRAAGAAAGIAPVIPEASTAAAQPAQPNPIDPIMAIHTGASPAVEKNWEMIHSLFDQSAPIRQPIDGEPHPVMLPGQEGPEPSLTALHSGSSKLGGFLDAKAPLTIERIDQGQDIKTTPGGPILAPAAGIVVGVKTNPGGFGENYPIIRITDKTSPLFGKEIYIGHTHSTVKVGQHFQAGQTISLTGHGTPKEGNARTPGWAEIGFWPPGDMKAGSAIAPYLTGHK